MSTPADFDTAPPSTSRERIEAAELLSLMTEMLLLDRRSDAPESEKNDGEGN